MPIIIGTENPQREFRQSNTYTAIKCLLNSLVLSKVAPFNSNTLIQDKTFEMLLTQDCENWSSNITHTPFKLFIYLCHNNVHTIIEIWTLTLSPSFPRDDLSTESLIDDLSLSDVNKSIADELIKSMQGFLTLLPFHVWAKSSMLGKNELPWEPQYGKSSFPLNIDNLNCFRFQDVETSHGKLTLQVEYLPQLGFPTGSQKPILVISPLHSHTITRCHSDYSLVVPITSPESDHSFSFLSSSLNSSNNESNSMDDIIFTPDINIQLSSPIGKQNESPFKFPLPISPTKQINPSNFSTPTARPGTPPPNRSLLNRSAPVGIPRAKSSPMSISGFSSSNEDDSPINPFGLSRSVPTTWLNDDDDIDEIKTYRRHSISLSPSELIGPFVGSFQESLLSGHMSNTPSTLYTGFVADLAASGKNFIPPHIKISFNTIFYHVDHETPYVGTIELDKRGYKVPQKGIVQVTVLNPSQTPIKTFLVKYDLTDMPPQTKTFVRQKIVGSHPFILRYAIHLKFVQPKKGKFYLYKNIRIVFAHRTPDENEALQTLYEYPDEPKYFPYSRGSSARLRRSLSTSADSLNSSTEIVDNEDDDSTDYSTKTVVDDSVTMSL